MDLGRKRWLLLISSCFINLCIGAGYAWSVFAGPLAGELKVESVTIVYTISNAIVPFIMIAGGAANDRLGPRWLVRIGGILFGVGTFCTGLLGRSLWSVILFYSILASIGSSMCYSCTVSNTVKFFPDRRGLVGGITTATVGLSSVIIPLVASALIEGSNVFTAFEVLGIVYFVLVMGFSFLQMKLPDGWMPEGYFASDTADGPVPDKNWRQMLRDPIFYPMFLLLLCGAFFGTMIISQAALIAQNMIGMTPAAAAASVSVLALFNVAGRLCAGAVSDRIGRINTLIAALVLALAGILLLIAAGQGQITLFYVGVVLIGISFGAFMSVFPGLNVDRFGVKNSSLNYSILFVGYTVAGVIAPLITSGLYVSSGSYDAAFLIGAALVLLGFVLAAVYKAMVKKRT